MWIGAGPREARKPVTFQAPFLTAPVVHVGLGMWDSDGKSNQRMDLSAEAVLATGFDLVFRTWGDSRVARVRADWIAIGEVRGADDWDID